MSRRKADTFYWRIAVNNTKMSNDVYKQMLKKSKLIDNSISLAAFREAYHSKQTTNESRLLLLSSLYDSGGSFAVDLVNSLPSITSKKLRYPALYLDGKKGQRYFTLGAYSPSKRVGVDMKLTNEAKRDIKYWKPWADKNQLLTKTLVSGNAQKQKVAVLLGEISTCLYATADLFATNIRANDPYQVYLITSPIEGKSEQIIDDMSKTQGDYKYSESKFLNHLMHMANEYPKYFPILNKLGINTLPYENKFSELVSSVNEFINTDYHSSDLETEALYSKVHEMTQSTFDELRELASLVENIDLDSSSIYNLKRLENIPTFVDYRNDKLTRHSSAVNEGVVSKIDEIFKKMVR